MAVSTISRPVLAALAVAGAVAAACTTTSTSVTAPSSDKCQISATPAPGAFTAAGGSGTLSVTAARDCSWSVAANVAWVSVGGDRSGQGNATIAFTVAANPTPAPRNGALMVAGASVELDQAGAPCRFTLSRGSDTIDAGGGRLSVDVSTLNGCNWTATSNASWLSIVSGASGNASATISLSIAANGGGGRVGQLNVAGQTYTVNQEGAAPPPSPTPAPSPSPAPGPSPSPSPGPSPTPPPAPAPPPPPPPRSADFSGTVTNVGGRCPNLSFNAGGATVITDGNTKFKGISCDDVAKGGKRVSGSGAVDAGGVIHAATVQNTDDKGDGQ